MPKSRNYVILRKTQFQPKGLAPKLILFMIIMLKQRICWFFFPLCFLTSTIHSLSDEIINREIL